MAQHAHDILAEQALLGASILAHEQTLVSFLAVPERAYYTPKHQVLAGVIRDMAVRNQPVDQITLMSALQDAALLSRVGGAPYLLTLVSRPYLAVNADFYASRIIELFGRRELWETLTRERAALDADWDSGELARPISTSVGVLRTKCDEVVNYSSVAQVTESRSLDDFLRGSDTYDWLVPGLLERGDRVILTGAEGFGKMLRIDEPVPTPDGWSAIGLLRPGDRVLDRFGRPCRVTWVSPVEAEPDAYAVRFSDGSVIEACADHQWVTVDYADRQRDHTARVRTTAQIRDSLRARNGHTLNHAVPVAEALELPAAELPLDPYALGVWLGDGDTAGAALTLNRLDAAEIESQLDAAGLTHHRQASGGEPGSVRVWIVGGNALLREAGVLGHKHIPARYLRASRAQRAALLAGLLDSDGWVIAGASAGGRGHGAATCELTLCNKTLAMDAAELIRTLGVRVQVVESDSTLNGRVVGRRWRMHFQAPENPFRVSRKASRWIAPRTRRSRYRYITGVEPVTPTPMRCITVDSPDSTYLVGEQMIPTHNTELFTQLVMAVAGSVHPFTGQPTDYSEPRVLIIDCENPEGLTRRRYRRIAGAVDSARAMWEAEPLDWGKRIRVEPRRDGLNLLDPADVAWLEAMVAANSPDLLALGPLYKLHNGNVNDAEQMGQMLRTIDRLRARHGFALLTEAHASKAQGPSGQRTMEPEGSAVFLRWPEFGMGLRRSKDDPDGQADVVFWRGSREEREWPGALFRRHAGLLPWGPDPGYFDALRSRAEWGLRDPEMSDEDLTVR